MSQLENGIELCGYTLSSGELRPGDVLTMMLFWKSHEVVSEDYHVFVHLVDEDEHIWAQHDGPPGAGSLPTSQWTAGQRVYDIHAIEINPKAPPGEYDLLVGMYAWPSLQRLPARSNM